MLITKATNALLIPEKILKIVLSIENSSKFKAFWATNVFIISNEITIMLININAFIIRTKLIVPCTRVAPSKYINNFVVTILLYRLTIYNYP